MKFIAKLFLACVMFTSYMSVFAIDTPMNITANNITETSIDLSWDTVEDALGYNVYYSETTPVDKLTAENREYLSENSINISELNWGTQYNFVVTAFDEVGWVSEFSSEMQYTTFWTSANTNTEEEIEFNSAIDFKISGIDVLAQNQVSLSFTSQLENWEDSERVFKIVEKNDEFMEYSVQNSEIDQTSWNKVIITLEKNLPINTEFKLTVISILDAQGRNIESGIESFENFIIEEAMLNVVYLDETNSIVIINPDTWLIVEEPDTNNSNNSQDNWTWNYWNIWDNDSGANSNTWTINNDSGANSNTWNINNDSGVNETQTWWVVIDETDDSLTGSQMNEDDIDVDLLSAGKEAEVLPTTWPEHIFMLILALMFGAMTFVFKFRKS